jgi:hypothetical protein
MIKSRSEISSFDGSSTSEEVVEVEDGRDDDCSGDCWDDKFFPSRHFDDPINEDNKAIGDANVKAKK